MPYLRYSLQFFSLLLLPILKTGEKSVGFSRGGMANNSLANLLRFSQKKAAQI